MLTRKKNLKARNRSFKPSLNQLETRNLLSVLPTIVTDHPALAPGTTAVKYEASTPHC